VKLEKLLLSDSSKPILSGQSQKVKLSNEHWQHLILLRDIPFGKLKYAHIRKYKSIAKAAQVCGRCLEEALRFLCYLKVHEHLSGISRSLTVEIWKAGLSGQDSQETYENHRENLFHVADFGLASPASTYAQYKLREGLRIMQDIMRRRVRVRGDISLDDLPVKEPFQPPETCVQESGLSLFTRCVDIAGRMPPISCFPWVFPDKESKFFKLSFMDRPDILCEHRFREKARIFLRKYQIDRLHVPDFNLVMKYGKNKYSDAGVLKPDSERPEFSFSGAFRYQELLTGTGCLREVWVPSKAYKTISSYWHLIGEQLLNNVPYVFNKDDLSSLTKKMSSRFRACYKVDLKGEALMMPRSYFIIIMEEIISLYPDSFLVELVDIVIGLFSELSVEVDGLFYFPTRGVGLGYFNAIKTMMSAIIADPFDPVVMFCDDMLFPQEHRFSAPKSFESLGMLLNVKKEKLWLKSVYFAGMYYVHDLRKFLIDHMDFDLLVAYFSHRFFWERKSIAHFIHPRMIAYLSFHTEKIFGYEFYKGESLKNPYNLGINSNRPRIEGYNREYLIHTIPHPWWGTGEVFFLPFSTRKDKDDALIFHKSRKRQWLKREYVYDYIYEFSNPRILNSNKRAYIKQHPPDKPEYLEIKDVVLFGLRSEFFTKNLSYEEYMFAIEKYTLSQDPIASSLSGGYEVLTPWYSELPVSQENQLQMYNLYGCSVLDPKYIYRVDLQPWRDEYPVQDYEVLKELVTFGAEDNIMDNREDILSLLDPTDWDRWLDTREGNYYPDALIEDLFLDDESEVAGPPLKRLDLGYGGIYM